MKATNIYQSLRSKGVCGTDGIPPKLPGISAAKFTSELRQASKDGVLNPGFKAAVDADTEKKSSAATYNAMANYGTAIKKLGPNDPPSKVDKNKEGEIVADKINTTSFDPKTGKGTRERILPSGKKVKSTFEVKPEKSSVLKKKSCKYKK